MRKSVLPTTAILLCLGCSIGATSIVFAWMESLILRPVPGVNGLARLVSLKTTFADGGDSGLSYPAYTDTRDAEVRAGATTFSGLAAFTIRRVNLRIDAAADARFTEPLWGVLASANYFDVLGVRPIAGRGFVAGEDALKGGARVVVISYPLWQRRFAGDPNVIGRRVWIRGRAMTVVGVAPREFYGTISRLAMDLWMPVTMQPEISGSDELLEVRHTRWLSVFGRLAPGATLSSARAAAQAAGARQAAGFPADRDVGMTARVLDVGPVDRMAPLFTVMLGITGLVLLIACSNVANLLLQRGAAREHEIAVRLALGASPARVVRQLLTESLVLAAGGVLVGAAVLFSARNALAGFVPASPLPVVAETAVDVRVLLVMAGVGLSTIVLFGLAPALRSTRVAVRASLAGGGVRGGSRSTGRLRGVLISAQFALSLAVLVSAGLFLRRLDELQHVDRGFRDPEQVLLMTVDFELAELNDRETRKVLVERMIERLSALPGVRAAAAASFVPLGLLGHWWVDTHVDEYVPRPGESTGSLVNAVSRGYFDLMGIPIKQGRGIDESDRSGTLAAAVVNEAFARRYWGSRDPIGRGLRILGDTDLTVVGVAANGKYEFLAPLDAPSPPFIYLPVAQWGNREVVLHVRADGDPLALVPSIERVVADVDGRLSAMSPGTLEAFSSVPYLPVRLATFVLSVLGAVALLLATIGLYAVTAYAVTQQRREIGIRMALGATPVRIASHFLAHAARYTGVGVLAGAALAVTMTYGLATKLPGSLPRVVGDRVSPFALALVLLSSVAALAALIPAWRAARVNPTTTLRDE